MKAVATSRERRILVLGATSAIAQEVARAYAGDGAVLVLVGRDAQKLSAAAADLKVRGAQIAETISLDLNDTSHHSGLVERALAKLGQIDIVLIAHGVLGDQVQDERDFALQEAIFRSNFLSAASLLTTLAAPLEKQGSGVIAVISSVAGDRGRQSNYVYGSSKAALTVYAAGLRARLANKGVHVVTVLPGFVSTPMTSHLPQGPLFVSAATVGQGIRRAIEKRRDIVYLPFFWRFIMLIIKSIPERFFKRLSL